MADFCKQCSEKIFGDDFRELANITTPEDTTNQLYASTICEGCGWTLVDHEGKCVADDCLEKGHKPEIKCPVVENYKKTKPEDDIPF